MIWTIIVIIFFVWLIGWLVEFGGNLIHLLLVIVFVGLLYSLLAPKNTNRDL